jgi:drug/metabolite transporter (DMT)-like permease
MKAGSSTRGYIELVITAVIWGITYVLMKYSLLFLDPEQIAFSRFLIASVVFLPIFFIFRERYTRREVASLISLVLTGVLGYQLLFIIGEQGVSAGDASFIVSFEPILIVILSISIREERFSWLLLIGLIVSTAGLVFLMKPTSISRQELFSAFLILMSALSWGIYTVLGKNLLKKHNPLNVTSFVSMVGVLFLMPFTGSGLISLFHVHSLYLILSLIFIGLGGTFVGYYLWFDGLKLVKPSLAGTTLYITPFVTVLVASLLISEPISVTSLIGGSLIIAGLAISSLKGNR